MGDVERIVEVSPEAETAVVNFLSDIFSEITVLDSEVVFSNIQLGCEGGFSESDRTMRIELGNYLMSHFALILTGLIVNDDFRNVFEEAVSVEIALLSRDSAFVEKIRAEMPETKGIKASKGNYVINFSKYNDLLYRKVCDKILSSFSRVESFEETLDAFIAGLTDDERASISFIISNFMFLFRALAHNGLFTDYIKEVIHTVQDTLEIE